MYIPKAMFNYFTSFVLLSFLVVSCVKDTDFDQNVVPSAVVELNFIYFTLQIDDFQLNPVTEGTLTVIDTTEIRFLNDDFAADNIKEASFFFRVSNSFPVELDAHFIFLSEENIPFYEIRFPIQLSDNGTPIITEHTHLVNQEDIQQLTLNEKVVVMITLFSDNQSLEGILNLQSKTTYYLEFSDL